MADPLYPDGAVLLAPVAGHTDLPMRLVCREQGCRYAFTEMLDAGSLVFQTTKTLRMAVRSEKESFLGVQLVGSEPDTLARAAEILNDMDFDVLDFNLGCPAPKVARKTEGISLALKRPDDALRAVEMLVRTSRVPVSVKTRIQSETDPEKTVSFCRRLRSAGIAALTLHGRVMSAFYAGPVHYEIIRAVREALDIPVIANGGGLTPESFRTLLRESGCSRGMIARGALGNPWIFRELAGGEPPRLSEFCTVLERHVNAMLDLYGEETGFPVSRKTVLAYLRGRGFPGSLRASVSFLSDRAGLARFLEEVRKGPSPRYTEFLMERPEEVERKLLPDL